LRGHEISVRCARRYTSRLWCIIELFTFMKVKGGIDTNSTLETDSGAPVRSTLQEKSSSEGSLSSRSLLNATLKDIEIYPMTPGNDKDSKYTAWQSLAESFRKFDANDAQCFDLNEKEKMLGVIERGFGKLDDFNSVVRRTIRQNLRRTSTYHSLKAHRANSEEDFSLYAPGEKDDEEVQKPSFLRAISSSKKLLARGSTRRVQAAEITPVDADEPREVSNVEGAATEEPTDGDQVMPIQPDEEPPQKETVDVHREI